MYAIYGNIYHQYTPNVSIYIYHTWILWVMQYTKSYPPLPSKLSLEIHGFWDRFPKGTPVMEP